MGFTLEVSAVRCKDRLLLLLVGSIGTLPVLACERPVEIRTDLEGQYYIVEEGGFPEEPVIVDKRVWPGGVYFMKREFHCREHRVRYLGEGESIEAMEVMAPEVESRPMEPGSIPDQLARIVCTPGRQLPGDAPAAASSAEAAR